MDKPDRPMNRRMNNNPETIQQGSGRVTDTDDPLFVPASVEDRTQVK